MSSSSSRLEVLLEVNEFKRVLRVPDCASLLASVSHEVKKLVSLPHVKVVLADGGTKSNFFLQIWSEKWGGYIDLQDVNDVTDGAKLKVVTSGSAKMESPEGAVQLIEKIKTLTTPNSKLLAGMFSSTSLPKQSGSLEGASSFNPTNDCLSAFSRQKKKRFRCKPSSVSVVVLAKFRQNIPRGRQRDQLRDAGRVRIVQFQRNMSPKQVSNCLKQAFKSIKLDSWTYCSSSGYGMLHASESQQLSGEDIVSKYAKSSLYICESEVPEHVKEKVPDIISRADKVLSKLKAPILPTSSESENDDEELPIISISTSMGPSTSHENPVDIEGPIAIESLMDIEETREIKRAQDEEFSVSLQIDGAKSMAAQVEQERREQVRRIRIALAKKFKKEPENGVRVYFRIVAESNRHAVVFNSCDSIKVLYEYIFYKYAIDTPFTLFQTMPRLRLAHDAQCGVQSYGDAVLAVEETADSPDPLTYLAEYEEYEESFEVLLRQAEEERTSFMQLHTSIYGFLHHISRDDIYSSTLSLYKEAMETIISEYPFRVKFDGEAAVDSGGVSRDFFSSFWEKAYAKAFDGNTRLTPALHSGVDLECLGLFGAIISHGYLAAGFLPVRIALPSLMCIFFGPNIDIPNDFMVESFIDSLSAHECDSVKSALNVAKGCGRFSDQQNRELVDIFSRYGSRGIPSPGNLKGTILQAAKYEFVMKPCAALTAMHSGIPKKLLAFWEEKSVYELRSLYLALSATPVLFWMMVMWKTLARRGSSSTCASLWGT